jgi:hypothetical protein
LRVQVPLERRVDLVQRLGHPQPGGMQLSRDTQFETEIPTRGLRQP